MIGINLNGYQIIDYIGKGSFGTVYRCEHGSKEYAIKIFNLDYVFHEFRNHGDNNRITREIEALKRANHKNIIKFIDNGFYEENKQTYVYVVMEYLKGKELKEYINSETISLDTAKSIFQDIVSGLEEIHKNGIIHRDLKPENIFITDNSTVKILDFGLSKLINFSSITNTGDMIGSPLYMSPEQIRDSKNIDYRSDYYALGVILFELITKNHPYGEISSRDHLFYKIINEKPLSVLQFEPSIPNYLDNLIENLLKKLNYERPNTINDILLHLESQPDAKQKQFAIEPGFYVRTWNEKNIFAEFLKDGNRIDNVIFPINHQDRQKGLLDLVKKEQLNYFIDPSTLRLAYDTFADVKGLVSLPYAPTGYNRLEVDDFIDLEKKKRYVKLVVDEQLKHNPSYIVSPFHVSNNSNITTIKNDMNETWFTLDIKLLKETKDFMNAKGIDKPLVGGFCVKTDILTTKTEREYFINVLSGLPCDIYWLYVDCIDNNANSSQIFHYISSLLTLQKVSKKPVIAGRVGPIGLLLLAFGLSGFESGTARFEAFYEDLFKDDSDSYNMYVMYYMPELFKNVPVARKDPSKIISILQSKTGKDIMCKCPYCIGKQPDQLIVDSLTRKHFLYRRNEEIQLLVSMDIPQRIEYITEKINQALANYKALSPIFKDSDYAFLRNWQRVIPDLRAEFGV